MSQVRKAQLLCILFLTACKDKGGDTAEVTPPTDTATETDTATDTAADTATDTAEPVDDEDLPATTVTLEGDLLWDEDVSLGSLLYVPAGVTLTINGGVTVAFQPGAGIVVDGVIDFVGGAQLPVTFTNDDGLTGSNYGLNVGGSADASDLDWGHFIGINVTLEGMATDAVEDATFSDSTLTVLSRDGQFTVQNCTFTDNARDSQNSLVVREVPQLLVTRSAFSDGAQGVLFNGLTEGATVTVERSTFTDMSVAIVVGNQGNNTQIVEIDEVDITGAYTHGITLYRSEATLSDVTVSGSLGYGIYTDPFSNLVASDVVVSATDNTCVYAAGSAQLSDIALSDCGVQGIYIGEGGGSVSGATVSGADSFGIYGAASLTVADSTISDTIGTGIYVVNGDVVVTGSAVSNSVGGGVYAEAGSLTASDTTVADVVGHGFYSSYGALTVSGVSVTGARAQGIYGYQSDVTVEAGSSTTTLSDIGGNGVYTYQSDISLANLSVTGVSTHGVYAYQGSIEATDTVISEAEGAGIYTATGDIVIYGTASGVEISDVYGAGVYANSGSVTASDLSVTNARSVSVWATYGNAIVSSSSISGGGSSGVVVNAGNLLLWDTGVDDMAVYGVYVTDGDATLTNVAVSDTENIGVFVNDGETKLTDTTVTGAGSYGVYVVSGGATLTNVAVSDANNIGVFISDGDMDITDITVSGAGSYGIYHTLGIGSISGATVSDTTAIGIYSYLADLTVEDAEIAHTGAQGLAVNRGALDATNVSVTDANSHGIYLVDGTLTLTDAQVSDVLNTAVYCVVADITIDGLEVTDEDGDGESAGDNGLYSATGYATISHASVEKVGNIGLYIEEGAIEYSEVVESISHGIYVFGHTASTITNTNVTDNGYFGIYGISWGTNLLDVSSNNITGSGYWGVAYVRAVDDNYVADNYGYTGADTAVKGTLDDVLSSTSDQIIGVDAITNARSTVVATAGP